MIDAAERSATEIAESAALLAKRASEIRIESEELISSLEETKADIQQQIRPRPAEASRQGRLMAAAAQASSEAPKDGRGERPLGRRPAVRHADVGCRQQPRRDREQAPQRVPYRRARVGARRDSRGSRDLPASRLEAAVAGLRSHFRAEAGWPWIAGLRGPE